MQATVLLQRSLARARNRYTLIMENPGADLESGRNRFPGSGGRTPSTLRAVAPTLASGTIRFCPWWKPLRTDYRYHEATHAETSEAEEASNAEPKLPEHASMHILAKFNLSLAEHGGRLKLPLNTIVAGPVLDQ